MLIMVIDYYSLFLVHRVTLIFVLLAFGPHSYASIVNAAVGGWQSGSTVCLTPMLVPNVLNAKQGNSMYHFQVLNMTRPGIEPRPAT